VMRSNNSHLRRGPPVPMILSGLAPDALSGENALFPPFGPTMRHDRGPATKLGYTSGVRQEARGALLDCSRSARAICVSLESGPLCGGSGPERGPPIQKVRQPLRAYVKCSPWIQSDLNVCAWVVCQDGELRDGPLRAGAVYLRDAQYPGLPPILSSLRASKSLWRSVLSVR